VGPEEPVGWEVGHDLLGRDLQAELDVCWCNHAHWGDTAARATLREDSSVQGGEGAKEDEQRQGRRPAGDLARLSFSPFLVRL